MSWSDDDLDNALKFLARGGCTLRDYQVEEILDDLARPRTGTRPPPGAGFGTRGLATGEATARDIGMVVLACLRDVLGQAGFEDDAAAFFARHAAPVDAPLPAGAREVAAALHTRIEAAIRQERLDNRSAIADQLAAVAEVLRGDLARADEDDAPDWIDEAHLARALDALLAPLPDAEAQRDALHALLTKVVRAILRQWEAGRTGIDVLVGGRPVTGTEAATTIRPAISARRAKVDYGPPLPLLSPEQIEAVQRLSRDKPWDARSGITPFQWVFDTYRAFIPGLLRHHLIGDRNLHQAFAQRVSREGLPEWLDVPTKEDADLRRISDPAERERVKAARAAEAEKRRQQRALARMSGKKTPSTDPDI